MPNLDYATLYGVETKHVNEQVKRLYFLTSYLPYFFANVYTTPILGSRYLKSY